MSFFEPLSESAPQPDQPVGRPAPWVIAGWNGPAEGIVGAAVHWSHNVVHDDRLCLRLDRVVVYPSGLTLDLELWVARSPLVEGKDLGLHFPWGLVDAGGPREELPDRKPSHPDDYMRFGVRYPDGRRLATGGCYMQHYLATAGLALIPRGGSYRRPWHKTVQLWLWPLPPPGDVALFVEWPALGIPETRFEIPDAALQEAYPRILELWPED